MAFQMSDRLDILYIAAIDRDASLMHANAVSATARWCGPTTTQAQVIAFVRRQIVSLEGHLDQLSSEIRASWQWLADELDAEDSNRGRSTTRAGSARPGIEVSPYASTRMINFGRRDRVPGRAHPSRIRGATA